MSRTPYSPFVLKATAPDPWNVARVVRVGSSWVVFATSAGVPRGDARGEEAAAPGNSERFRRD